MRRLYIADYTLRTLAQERSVPLLFREKTAISAEIERFGADGVELAPVRNLREDRVIYKTVAQGLKNCRLCLPCGKNREDIENAWSCIREAAYPCLQVELPFSPAQLEYIWGIKPAALPQKTSELVSAAAEICPHTEFVALDATRADRELLTECLKLAEASGAKAVTLCDDEGLSVPSEISELVSAACEAVSLPVYVKLSDNISLAVANALAALEAGAVGVKTSVCGGSALLTGKLAAALSARQAELNVETGLKLTEIQSDIDALLKRTNHEDFLGSKPQADSDIFLDSSSSVSDVNAAASVLGYELSQEDVGRVYDALMNICEKKSSVGSKELEAIIASWAMQAPSTYHLESYVINISNITTAMAHIIMIMDGEKISGVGVGDGPIDSAFMAIEQSIGHHYELDDFQIQSVTEGKESLGQALVKLRSGGRLYSGTGLSTDIVGASIRAYINALNKIVYEEN